MDCTGLKNILIVDQDGSLFGTPTSMISMNYGVGTGLYPSCKANTYWNGFECSRTDLALVEFEAVSPDR